MASFIRHFRAIIGHQRSFPAPQSNFHRRFLSNFPAAGEFQKPQKSLDDSWDEIEDAMFNNKKSKDVQIPESWKIQDKKVSLANFLYKFWDKAL